MAIEDRNLVVGTRLVAKYKKETYVCEVVETDDGVRYKLSDLLLFRSPSVAASAVMDGKAANGWQFWSLATEGETEASASESGETPTTEGAEPKKGRATRVIKRTPNQQGSPEGQTRWLCSGCGDSFFAATGETPEACPKGHQAELDSNGDLVTVPVAQEPAPEE